MPASTTVPILLSIYAAVVAISCVVTLILWYHSRDEYHRETLKLWGATFLSLIVQGIFIKKDLWTVLACCTSFVITFQLAKLLSLATNIQLPERGYRRAMAAAILLAIGISRLQPSFFWLSIFPSIGIALPIVHASLLTMKQGVLRKSGMIQIFLVLLIFYAAHFLDYPFLRADDAYTFFGFSVGLGIIFCLSIFLPSYSIANISARYSGELEREVQRRTESLVSANAELKALSNEHDHLLRLVIHDIASPLSVVTMLLDGLGRKVSAAAAPVKEDTYERMQLATSAITEVLKNVRNLHSVRSGKLRLNLTPVSIRDALSEQLKLFEPRLRAKQLKVRIEERNTGSLSVLAEPTSLKNHVLANLISNAIKFSEPGGEIVLSIEDIGGAVEVKIIDHGIGIPPELMPKLFEMNQPTSRPGTTGEKGTGFGMPIVKTYLDRYGAQIHVRSRVKSGAKQEHGTEFHIQFKKAA